MSAGRRLEHALADSLRYTAALEAMSPVMRLHVDRENAYARAVYHAERAARGRIVAVLERDLVARAFAGPNAADDERLRDEALAEVKRLDREIAEMERTP